MAADIYLKALRALPATVPLPSILIAVCIPMCSYCECGSHVCITSCRVCRGKLCHFFTKARNESIMLLLYGRPNHHQILTKCLPKGRGGTPWRALSAPKRPKSTQELPKRPPETTKKRPKERLGALLRRFGCGLSDSGAFWKAF